MIVRAVIGTALVLALTLNLILPSRAMAEDTASLIDDVPEIELDAPSEEESTAGPETGLEELGLGLEQGPDRRALSELEREKLALRAEAGEVISQVRLARNLRDGSRGFEQDREAAFRWFLKAARKENLEAVLNVATMYYAGSGIRQAPAHAYHWYLKAAERGHPMAEMAVGEMYYYGIGTEQDYGRAFEWLRLAAERGEPNAQFRIGTMYREGLGVSESRFQAYLWFHLASLTGDSELRVMASAERDAIDAEFTEAERLGAMLVSEEYEQMFVDPALLQMRDDAAAEEAGDESESDIDDLPQSGYESPMQFD
ncbi:MAG: tetratricopeptide repeat protein [Pseudomonadota bacterium]